MERGGRGKPLRSSGSLCLVLGSPQTRGRRIWFAARRPPAPIILAIEILEGARCTSLLDLVFGIFSEGHRTVLGQLPEFPETKMAPKRLLEAPGGLPKHPRESSGTTPYLRCCCIVGVISLSTIMIRHCCLMRFRWAVAALVTHQKRSPESPK